MPLRPPQTDEIATQRLILRPPQIDDVAALHGMMADPAVCRFLPQPAAAALPVTTHYLACCQYLAATGAIVMPVLTRRDCGGVIGFLQYRCRGDQAGEIGFLLSAAHWGHGFMVEAITALLGQLSAIQPATRMWAACDAEHQAAHRTLMRSGLVAKAVLPRHRVHPAISPEPRDCILFETGPDRA